MKLILEKEDDYSFDELVKCLDEDKPDKSRDLIKRLFQNKGLFIVDNIQRESNTKLINRIKTKCKLLERDVERLEKSLEYANRNVLKRR